MHIVLTKEEFDTFVSRETLEEMSEVLQQKVNAHDAIHSAVRQALESDVITQAQYNEILRIATAINIKLSETSWRK